MNHRSVVARILLTLAVIAAAVLVAVATAMPTRAAPASAVAPPLTLGAPFTSPDGLWTWSRPLPHGYPAHMIAAPAPGTLFVATSEPDLLVTRDGGATWAWNRTSAVPGFASPQGIQFVSSQEGWTWGTDAAQRTDMLLHTTDCGASWQPSLTMSGTYASDVFTVRFAGPFGWVLRGSYDTPALYTTTDGGQTWSPPLTVPRIDSDDTTFAALAPQGGEQAVLADNDEQAGSGMGVATPMWRTTDMGVTWQPLTTLKGVNIRSVAFTSASKGWATNPTSLWSTTNGGASWHKVRSAPGSDRLTVTGDGIWAVPNVGPPPGSPPYYALHSTDDGATWREVPGLGGAEVAFADTQDGWVARGDWLNVYLHTTDGGTTWSHVTNAPKSTVNSLAATPDGTVWGAADYVIRSADGGAHWQRVTRRRRLLAVAAVSANQAWAVGRSGVAVHTADGGHHWTVQHTGVDIPLRQVFFFDAKHGWAGGDKGTLLRTVDGGRNWSVKTFGSGVRIGHIVFADAQHGIALLGAVTTHPALLCTSNGGRTWSWIHLQYWPGGVIMEDATHALLVAGSTSWASSDGGKTWQRGTDLPLGGAIVSLARSGSQLCAVGAEGAVVTSTDGGLTWSNDGLPAGSRAMLTSVQFVGSDTLMIGGVLGVLTRDLTTAPLP